MHNKIKRLFLLSALFFLHPLFGRAILERFDTTDTRGTLNNGAVIDPQAGLERGALVATGNGTKMQYFYSYEMPVTPGETFALALNYRTTDNFPTTGWLAVVAFTPEPGKTAPPSFYGRSYRMSNRWMHRRHEFTIPDGVRKARVLLRFDNVPDTEQLRIDNLRVAPVIDGIAKGIDLTDFETDFDQWSFDRHLIFDHLMPGPGASIENEWRKAKVGEAFLQAKGSGEPMQYAFYIENIVLKPQHNYIFEAWLNATDSFSFAGNGILIFFYKDANGKAIGQSRYHIRPTAGEWKEFAHTFTAPENSAWLDIGMNMRKMTANDVIQLDHIRLRQGDNQVSLRYDIDPDTRKMAIVSYLIGNINKEDVTHIDYLVSQKEQVIRNIPGKIDGETIVDLTEFSDGEYQLSAQAVFKDGSNMSSDPVAFGVYNHPDWLNDIGIYRPTDPAPAPWKHLQLNGQQVRTWNNCFTFNKALQLQQLTGTDGRHPWLSAPMSLTFNQHDVLGGDKNADWEAGSSMVKGTSTFRCDDFTCQVNVSIDYVGFMRYTLHFSALRDFTLNQGTLALNLPEVDFIHRCDGTWTEVGAVDLNRHQEWSSKHLYFLQFGNIKQGICFYTPKLWPAVADFEKEWVKASKKGDLTMQLINAPLTFSKDGTFTIEFALCPYPFRPAEDNWKKIRFRAGANSNCDLLWQTASMMPYAGSLLAFKDSAEVQTYLKEGAEYQLVYQIPTYILETIPQWSYFRKKWRGLPARAYDFRASHGGMMPKGDFRERTWVDLYIKTMVDHLREHNWGGIYYDCFSIDSFQDNGGIVLPVFENRAFHERVYHAQRLNNPNSFTISHVGADQASTLTAFSNVVLMGEQYRGNFVHHRYFLDFLTLDEFRYENVVNIGPDRMLLPQYRRAEDVNSPELTTHVMGMALAHNLMIYPNFIVKEVELRFRDRQFAFGMQDSEFFPYWEPNPDGLKTSNPEVKISYWKNTKGIFAVILNASKAPVNFTVTAPGKLSGEFYDPFEDKTSPWQPGMQLHMAPYLAALLTIK